MHDGKRTNNILGNNYVIISRKWVNEIVIFRNVICLSLLANDSEKITLRISRIPIIYISALLNNQRYLLY